MQDKIIGKYSMQLDKNQGYFKFRPAESGLRRDASKKRPVEYICAQI